MIFKNVLLLSLTLGIVLSLTMYSVYATEAIDQSFTGPFDVHPNLLTVGSKGVLVQAFAAQKIVPTVDHITALDIYLDSPLSCTRGGVVDVVLSDSSTGVILSSTQISGCPKMSTPTHIVFTEPISLTVGSPLTLEAKQQLAGARDIISWRASTDRNSYPSTDGIYRECLDLGCPQFVRLDYGFATYYEIPTPEEQTQEIVDDVLELLTSGDISTQSANSLTSTLENAIDKIEDGNTDSATGMLGAFINKVEQMIQTGKISPEDGQALIDAANSVINSL